MQHSSILAALQPLNTAILNNVTLKYRNSTHTSYSIIAHLKQLQGATQKGSIYSLKYPAQLYHLLTHKHISQNREQVSEHETCQDQLKCWHMTWSNPSKNLCTFHSGKYTAKKCASAIFQRIMNSMIPVCEQTCETYLAQMSLTGSVPWLCQFHYR